LLVQRKVTKRKHTLPSRPARFAVGVRCASGVFMASILGGHPSGIADAMFKTSPGSFVVRDIPCPAKHDGHPCPSPCGLFPAGSAATEGNPKSGKATAKTTATANKTTAKNNSKKQQQQQKPLSQTPLPQVGEGLNLSGGRFKTQTSPSPTQTPAAPQKSHPADPATPHAPESTGWNP